MRSLRKGAVELEEQNAVLSSHITELTDVVKELRNAKAIMQVCKQNNYLYYDCFADFLMQVLDS